MKHSKKHIIFNVHTKWGLSLRFFSLINGYTENWFDQNLNPNSFITNCRASDNNIGVIKGKYGVRV